MVLYIYLHKTYVLEFKFRLLSFRLLSFTVLNFNLQIIIQLTKFEYIILRACNQFIFQLFLLNFENGLGPWDAIFIIGVL